MKTRAFVLIVESNFSGDFDFHNRTLSRLDLDRFFSWLLPPASHYQNPNISLIANESKQNQDLSD